MGQGILFADVCSHLTENFVKWTRDNGTGTLMAPDELGRLVAERGPALVLYARQWCSTAEDAVQAAFVRLAVAHPVPEEPVPWLYAAVRNSARAAGRAKRRRHKHESAAAIRDWFAPAPDADWDGPQATAALSRLHLDEREVIVAHLWGGLTFEQIGSLIGVSAATAYRRYTAGLEAIRQLLGEPCRTN